MISFRLSKDNIGKLNVTQYSNEFTFGYPCNDSILDCTPYTVELSAGLYRIEAWGSAGSSQISSINAGLGGYTSGILNLNKSQKIYLFVGSISIFNYVNYVKNDYDFLGGGSSDVRLYVNESFEWSDARSLRSRIMVAAGGGGSEWSGSIGGNGGGLEGGSGQSDCHGNGEICPDVISTGATQRNGGTANYPNGWKHADGKFGIAPIIEESLDMGGMGGNGYWSGATFDYAGAGSGGSSFVSGHEGCIALKSEDSDEMSETNNSIHYSNIAFENPSMQRGNTSMPLYYSRNSHGIGNKGRGCIRITILNYSFTCNCRLTSRINFFIHVFILIYDS